MSNENFSIGYAGSTERWFTIDQSSTTSGTDTWYVNDGSTYTLSNPTYTYTYSYIDIEEELRKGKAKAEKEAEELRKENDLLKRSFKQLLEMTYGEEN